MAERLLRESDVIAYLTKEMNWYTDDGYEVDEAEKHDDITDIVADIPSAEPEKEDDVLLVDAVKRAYDEGREAEGKLLDEVVEKAEREKEELNKECSLLRWKYANAMRIIKDLEQRIGEGK